MSVWRETPTLAGRHVTLRPMVREDCEELLLAFEGLHSLFHTTVPTAETFDAWYDRVMFDTAAGRNLPFTVLDADGRISGVTRLMRMSEAHRRVEIGGTLYAPRVQRTGLNTEAKYMLLGHAFEMLSVNCVQIRTDFLNHASRRAIERLGARLDGILRGHLILNGHLRDSAVYSILAHEWPGVRRNLELLMARHGVRA
ncbi:GNAT family N-acetyltransferase [Sphingomonas sp. Root241]|uniref:GNAT family N-acetyltransferase n=1 Tax=Sphingomonas sp. Root241 TaxID=1736501 RepID=UPI0006FED7BF|nr:GNAT family protein [Sphingomonas sp. Root241]KRC81885.1 acetyltransferase [Sphingomonas sp. Root241]